MRILFTICGRAGSKGIRNKNIKLFVGKPLPYYTLSAIDLYLEKHGENECDIVVNSDSQELLSMMSSSGIRPVELIERNRELGGDTISKIDVMHNCLDIMQGRKKYEYDTVVDLDITSPLRRIIDIENLIETHIRTRADVTTSVVMARRNPYFNQLKRTEKGFRKVCASNFTARQQAPDIYDMNASLYAYCPEYLRSGRQVLDGYVEVIEMYDTGILDLDHENDLELMEVIAEYLFKHKDEFREIYENC
ncbi:acylneuraminate cytidylyltransferase family protein [Acetatifactor muris]|uniref:acylneuraminate cytidylyltransferase family protein n=1 Tax=Acetatifactor muris TaxID=879566 RepID=UPI0023F29414|nr:acylneuraminate cytidylyltransferase family protein [Acetatifactor muris]